MDSFSHYMEKQLLDYVEAERKKGIPLDVIKNVLLQAGHEENIIDKIMTDVSNPLEEKPTANPVENDLVGQLKAAFGQFMAQANKKQVQEVNNANTKEMVSHVVEQAEFIEEKTMLESFVFFVYLIALSVIIFLTGAATNAGFDKVLIGFFPAIVNAFIALGTVKIIGDNVPLFMAIPVGIGALFYALGMFTTIPLFATLDIEPLAVVNVILGFICNVSLLYVRFIKPAHMKKRPVSHA